MIKELKFSDKPVTITVGQDNVTRIDRVKVLNQKSEVIRYYYEVWFEDGTKIPYTEHSIESVISK